MNMLVTYMPDLKGWTPTMLNAPTAIGGWVSLPVILLTGWLVKKMGSFNTLKMAFAILSMVIIIGITDTYGIYGVAIVVTRCTQGISAIVCARVCTDWFNNYRGRALGIATVGAPLSGAFCVPLLHKITRWETMDRIQ